MRVALAASYPIDAHSRGFGGVNQAVFQLVRALDRIGDLDLHVLAVGDADCERQLGDRTTLHVYRRQHPGYDAALLFRGRRRALAALLKKLSPDLVHSQEPPAEMLVGAKSGYPCVMTVHGIYRNHYRAICSQLGWRERLKWWSNIAVERRALRLARHVIAITDEIVELARRYAPDVCTYRVDNPIDESYFSNAVGPAGGKPTILYAGFVNYRKGADLLLAATSRLISDFPGLQARFVGNIEVDSRFVAWLRDKYAHLFEAGSAVLVGPVAPDMLRDEYAKCTLFCLPSRAESAPMVIAEAMAAGRPVVATRVGGVPQMVVDGVSGLLCTPHDTEGLCERLRSLLVSPSLQREMGLAGQQVARDRYWPDTVARRTVEVYRQVLARERRACDSPS